MAFYKKIKNGKLSLEDIKKFAEDSGLDVPAASDTIQEIPAAPTSKKKSKSEIERKELVLSFV